MGISLTCGRPPYRPTVGCLNTSSGLGRGLVFACFPGDGAVDLVTGLTPNQFSGYSATATAFGPASLMTQASNNAIYYGTYTPVVPANGYTLAAIAAPTNVGQVSALIGARTSGGADLLGLFVNTSSNGTAAAGEFSLIEYSSGFLQQADNSSGPSVSDGKPHCYMGVRYPASAVPKVYFDGIDATVGTDVANAGNAVMPQKWGVSGMESSASQACDFPVVAAFAWNRSLSAAEALAFAINPWRM